MDFADLFIQQNVEKGKIAIAWMGQAGFLFKNSMGKILALDVYLSDLAQTQDGNKRLMPALCFAEELPVDIVLASHHHTDHLDMESIPVWIERLARLYSSKTSIELCSKAGISPKQMFTVEVGTNVTDMGYRIEAVFADHGDTAKDAVGFLITSEDVCIYFTGDTSYQQDRMKYALEKKIDLLIVPINGEYGNMNERDAAMLASQANAYRTIPCHFWTFARHRGSPYEFCQEMKSMAPDLLYYLMAQGEILLITGGIE